MKQASSQLLRAFLSQDSGRKLMMVGHVMVQFNSQHICWCYRGKLLTHRLK